MSFFRKTYKIRKTTPTGGHQISLPPAWIEARKENEDIEVLYDRTVVVIVPSSVKVNEKVLSGAFDEK